MLVKMINPAQTDPAGHLMISLIGAVFGAVMLLFDERLFFSKPAKYPRVRKWGKIFFKICAILICAQGIWLIAEGAWTLVVHR